MSARSTLRRAWPVLVSYGVFSLWGVGCLFASLMLTSGGFGMTPGNVGVLFGVLAATVIGHVLGNLLGLAGLRLMPVVILFLCLLLGSTLSGLVLGAFALFLIIAIVAALGGYLGVASRLDVVAAWYPLSFAVGGAIHWMNHHGAVATFHGGSKHALWDPFTIFCLTGAVFFMLTFLATRHSLGLTVWQEVGRPQGSGLDPAEQVAVARPGRGSFVVLFLFTLVVLGSTALISPYLFRTRADDGNGPYKDDKGTSEGDGKPAPNAKGSSGGQAGAGGSSPGGHSSGGPSSGGPSSSGHSSGGPSGGGPSSGGPSSGGPSGGGPSSSGHSSSGGSSGGGPTSSEPSNGGSAEPPIGKPDTEHAGHAAAEALNLGMKLFVGLLVAAAALLVFMFVFLPPLRRAFLMRHLERPLWPVAPTARVMNLWRRALAVLGMIEIEPAPGETPRDFARRVDIELQQTLGCHAPGLKEAAAIVEKIDYAGRGLGAGEEQSMREAVDAFVRTVSARVGFKKKLAAAWGRPPEVES